MFGDMCRRVVRQDWGTGRAQRAKGVRLHAEDRQTRPMGRAGGYVSDCSWGRQLSEAQR